ncbi:hypothetical protein D3C86_1667140 [compost metagenome]
MDQRAWKLSRQCSALGLLLFLGQRRSGLQGLKFSFNRRDIGIDQVIEQAGLLWIQLLAALGKLQALELGDLVGQLLDNRLVAVDLLAHCLDLLVEHLDALYQLRRQRAQLFRIQVVEIVIAPSETTRCHGRPRWSRCGSSQQVSQKSRASSSFFGWSVHFERTALWLHEIPA